MLAENLKMLRRQAGLTQEELADRIGETQPYISELETGAVRNPRVETLLALADALGTTVDDLLR
jgi:transcriptional regulator with XRE-family HTH domain